MKPESHPSPQLSQLERKTWTAVFRISGFALIGCMVAIVGLPYTVGYSWVYWFALGSAVVCGAAAHILGKPEGEEVSDDAASLLGYRERGTRDRGDADTDD